MSKLLSCLEVAFRRVGGLLGSFSRKGERLSVSFVRAGGMDASFARTDAQLEGGFSRVGGMRCSFGMICTTSLGEEYVLWATDGMVLNKLGNKIYLTRKN